MPEKPEKAAEQTNGGRRLLLVARGFPPLVDPTAYRWFRFVSYLATHGWQIDVVTIAPSPRASYYDRSLVAAIPAACRIHRVYPGPYENLVLRRRFVRQSRGGASSREGASSTSIAEIVKAWIRRFLRRVDSALQDLKIPEEGFDWIPFAIGCGARLLRSGRYDVMVSSAWPFSCHIVGRWLNFWYRIPWVGDFSDPFVYSPFTEHAVWRRWIDKRLERGWLKHMDSVVFPVPEMLTDYHRHYPSLDTARVHVVPYGYAEEFYEGRSAETLPGFTIVHTGAFYAGLRSPAAFLQSLELVRDLPLKVIHAGAPDLVFEKLIEDRGLGDVVENRGFLTRERVAALQKGATILLLVGNKGGVQLPGKIFDYLAAGRPVLTIRNAEVDLAVNLIQREGRGLIVENEPVSIAAGIRELYGEWRDRTLDQRCSRGRPSEYSWSSQSRRLESILLSILQRPASAVRPPQGSIHHV